MFYDINKMTFANQFKTVLLLGVMTAFLLFIGQMVGGASGLTIAIVIALVMNVGSYWFSDKIVLAMYKGREVTENDAPRLYKMIREITQNANIPMPKVYITPQATPNAFATGRNPEHAAVAVTEGILDLLSEDELKGVLAHEVSHIKNRDILIATIAATIAAVIGYVAMMARFAAIFGGFGGRDENGGNILEVLFLAILAPVIAVIIQLAISRRREYMADASAAKILRNPYGLADALGKLKHGVAKRPFQRENQTGASLFIVNPFNAKGLVNLFSTHPPLDDRIRKLRNMDI